MQRKSIISKSNDPSIVIEGGTVENKESHESQQVQMQMQEEEREQGQGQVMPFSRSVKDCNGNGITAAINEPKSTTSDTVNPQVLPLLTDAVAAINHEDAKANTTLTTSAVLLTASSNPSELEMTDLK